MTQDHDKIDAGRRSFIGAAAGLTAATVAPGMVLHTVSAAPRSEAVTDAVRWGMLIDTARCAEGCTECVSACERENGLDLQVKPEGESEEKWDLQRAVWIRKVKVQDNLTGRVTNLPMLCQHCEHPPCVDVCPTGASFKRADGIVMVDRHTCIGCRYCMMACPYKARSFIHEDIHDQKPWAPRGKGTVESCTMCVSRVDAGGTPACVEACSAENHNALVFGDLYDENSEISQELKKLDSVEIRADLGLNTGVRYRGI